ncbi:DUF1896 domain-containing protein [Chryseobacterium gallinarum]|uniref:DUF1896 domain-containing protein n=1 Tax=Chryseobacterium gallinarum TaxID=1324352 RepID=UPI00202437A6|nr:DUF1896 domain-containing protein [Chryseobacterium gallinarum]MCL8537639.1 DUF1896 domain-containing protein [Chryseobacterium gallinarum]
MTTTSKEISYFQLRLQELLNTSFPELAGNKEFIQQRSDLAASIYEDAFISGNPIERCNEIANRILFEGLHFSKFDTVFQVVCNEFDTVMADEELRPFALKMFPVCEKVFDAYELTDDFAYTHDYDRLYTELTGVIAIWIEENGLQ